VPHTKRPTPRRLFALYSETQTTAGLLKREMYQEHPEVTTPGVWGIKEGAVVTMTLDRERGELTFEVADTPPFTLYNVSVRDSFPQNPRLANFGLDHKQSTVSQTKKN